jgi:hypothetical protein
VADQSKPSSCLFMPSDLFPPHEWVVANQSKPSRRLFMPSDLFPPRVGCGKPV